MVALAEFIAGQEGEDRSIANDRQRRGPDLPRQAAGDAARGQRRREQDQRADVEAEGGIGRQAGEPRQDDGWDIDEYD